MRSCSTVKGVGFKYHRHHHHASNTLDQCRLFPQESQTYEGVCSCVIIRVCMETIAITS